MFKRHIFHANTTSIKLETILHIHFKTISMSFFKLSHSTLMSGYTGTQSLLRPTSGHNCDNHALTHH